MVKQSHLPYRLGVIEEDAGDGTHHFHGEQKQII